MFSHSQILSASLVGLLLLKGCDKAPKYEKPPVQTPASYKEIAPDNFKETDDWKFAQPKDGVIRGNWWEMFRTPLNASKTSEHLNRYCLLMRTSVPRGLWSSSLHSFSTVTTSPSISLHAISSDSSCRSEAG